MSDKEFVIPQRPQKSLYSIKEWQKLDLLWLEQVVLIQRDEIHRLKDEIAKLRRRNNER